VTLSTRTREAAPAGGPRPVENYILKKARTLAESLPAGAVKERLAAAALAYEEVLADPEAGPHEVDPAEEELLELLEEATQAAETAEARSEP